MPNRELLNELLNLILKSSDLYHRVASHVRLSNNELRIMNHKVGKLYVIAIGKGSLPMSKAVEDIAGDKIIDGVAVVPRGTRSRLNRIKVIESTHPTPSEDSIRAGQEILNVISNVSPGDYVLFLISGGGSSLVELPAEGLNINDVIEVNNLLLRSGATIYEMNTVRKHISRIKGGKLALEVVRRGGLVITLMASDVPGDDPATIASGPTVPDPTTYMDAMIILKNKGIWDKIPESVRRHIEEGIRGLKEETPKELSNTWNYIIASNMDVLNDIRVFASSKGFDSLILTSRMDGEAKEIGRYLASIALEARFRGVPIRRGFIISGGEPTVTVRGNGRGGRTTELCTGFAMGVRGIDNVVLFSLATDGIDGNMDAAGCIADGDTINEALKMGIDPYMELNNNNTAIIYEKLGTLIKTGMTGSNLNIVSIIMVNT